MKETLLLGKNGGVREPELATIYITTRFVISISMTLHTRAYSHHVACLLFFWKFFRHDMMLVFRHVRVEE
jgi:hypothetical protein